MKFETPNCPTCGEPAMGTVDVIPGVALLSFAEDGEAWYSGETKVFWDGHPRKEENTPVPEPETLSRV